MTTKTLAKKCSHCKATQPLDSFHPNKTKRDGLSSICKECQRAASRKHYQANKEKSFARNKLTKERQRQRLLELKNRPCSDCGHTFHPYVMEMDHRDPSGKHFSIGRRGSVSDKQLREELAKCDLVCANCHKLRTFRRRQQASPGFCVGL